MSEAMEVGKRLVELCSKGQFDKAVDALYSQDVVTVEAAAPPGGNKRQEGIAAVRKKGEWWTANHEVHGAEVLGPWPHGDRFIAIFRLDITPKTGPMSGKRHVMEEAALYTVKGGKVVHEEFFYDM